MQTTTKWYLNCLRTHKNECAQLNNWNFSLVLEFGFLLYSVVVAAKVVIFHSIPFLFDFILKYVSVVLIQIHKCGFLFLLIGCCVVSFFSLHFQINHKKPIQCWWLSSRSPYLVLRSQTQAGGQASRQTDSQDRHRWFAKIKLSWSAPNRSD